tara:strand:- start:1016 stop:1123 length:108 start_codon:yes stop_codon:yes gene_type:complete
MFALKKSSERNNIMPEIGPNGDMRIKLFIFIYIFG